MSKLNLYQAIQKNDEEAVLKHLEIDDPSSHNNYAIRLAANNGNVNIIKILLKDKRVDHTADNDFAFKKIVEQNISELMPLFLSRGYFYPDEKGNEVKQFPNGTRIRGRTNYVSAKAQEDAFFEKFSENNMEMLGPLIRELRDNEFQCGMFDFAIRKKNPELFKFVYQKAIVDRRRDLRWECSLPSLYETAAECDQAEIIEFIMGLDEKNKFTDNLQKAIDIATKKGHRDALKSIFKNMIFNGISLKVAFPTAVKNGDIDIALMLLLASKVKSSFLDRKLHNSKVVYNEALVDALENENDPEKLFQNYNSLFDITKKVAKNDPEKYLKKYEFYVEIMEYLILFTHYLSKKKIDDQSMKEVYNYFIENYNYWFGDLLYLFRDNKRFIKAMKDIRPFVSIPTKKDYIGSLETNDSISNFYDIVKTKNLNPIAVVYLMKLIVSEHTFLLQAVEALSDIKNIKAQWMSNLIDTHMKLCIQKTITIPKNEIIKSISQLFKENPSIFKEKSQLGEDNTFFSEDALRGVLTERKFACELLSISMFCADLKDNFTLDEMQIIYRNILKDPDTKKNITKEEMCESIKRNLFVPIIKQLKRKLDEKAESQQKRQRK